MIDRDLLAANRDTPAFAVERSQSPPKLVVITGPTAVGKTAFGVSLARDINGEVVNADSRYLYRGVDIGVAKPTIAERRGIPHHLIDILPPDGAMSLAIFQELALVAIQDIVNRGRVPLLVGGSPLYLNAVVEGWRIPRVEPNPAFRSRLEAEAASQGVDYLIARLREVDPVAAARSAGNVRRVIRALEIFDATGIPMSQQEGKGPRPFHALELLLTVDRDTLYTRIDRRVEANIAAGLAGEVRDLLDRGLSRDSAAMSSIGYRQMIPFLDDELSLEEVIGQTKHATHKYVRHQETWFRRNPRYVKLDVSSPAWEVGATNLVRQFLAGETPDPDSLR